MAHKPIRLPPLKVLRVHDPKRRAEPHCVAVMSTVLACWASAGYNAAGCAAVENQLRACMDGPKPTPPGASTVNYHLARMKKHVTSRGKET
ncbi:37S ribosomal protein Mrp10 [Stachybotrys elegans]|uniref:Small ribosomal subunit protein mS37 n=1 Tax=Stachybotrys elegans TaxID=80388 RepID=A0A8K0SN32_9HYPO|nr:37S ribosomal protein Mrp10 [Stachybotrys elegans]